MDTPPQRRVQDQSISATRPSPEQPPRTQHPTSSSTDHTKPDSISSKETAQQPPRQRRDQTILRGMTPVSKSDFYDEIMPKKIPSHPALELAHLSLEETWMAELVPRRLDFKTDEELWIEELVPRTKRLLEETPFLWLNELTPIGAKRAVNEVIVDIRALEKQISVPNLRIPVSGMTHSVSQSLFFRGVPY